MKILVLNCGSSSLKFQLIDMENEERLVKGNFERIGGMKTTLKLNIRGEKSEISYWDLKEVNNSYENYYIRKCPKCNRELENDFEYCPYCGEKLK